MPFIIQSSTITNAIGTGAGDKQLHFNDLLYKFKLTSTQHADTAEALATFNAGEELVEAQRWALNAHGFTTWSLVDYDATTEADRLQKSADDEASRLAVAGEEAELIVSRAKIQASEILAEAEAILKTARTAARTAARTVAKKPAGKPRAARAKKAAAVEEPGKDDTQQ